MDSANEEELGTRWFELGVAALLAVIALLVITDSLRVGAGWGDDGPKAGYFPFYIGLILLGSAVWIGGKQVMKWKTDNPGFVEKQAFGQVIAILVPMIIHVIGIAFLGIYVASTILIAYFMKRYGKYGWGLTAAVAIGVPLIFFLIFERWFLVPLPKGPLEAALGF